MEAAVRIRSTVGCRASLSALDSPRSPVARRMRRILSVEDISSLDAARKSPNIYDQMRQLCSSRDDLTDLLQRELAQARNDRQKNSGPKRKPKHPEGELEIFVDAPPAKEVYRPIVRRRRHHRARMERRKMAAGGGQDDVTNNNQPITNGQYSTLDRLVRDQKVDSGDPSRVDTLDRPRYSESAGTLDRLSKRQEDGSISRTEFEQLCVFNRNEPESDTDTLTPSPGGSPKRALEHEINLRAATDSQVAITTARSSVTLQQQEPTDQQQERRPSVKDAISLFEKFKDEPKRITQEKKPAERTSVIVEDRETNLDADLDMAVSERLRNYENAKKESRARLPFKHSSELWAAPIDEAPVQSDRNFPKIIEPTKNRDSINQPIRKSPSPRRFITREPQTSPPPERPPRERELEQGEAGRTRPDRRIRKSPQSVQRTDIQDGHLRPDRVEHERSKSRESDRRETDRNESPRPDVPPRRRETRPEPSRLRVNVVPHYISGSDSSHSNDERPSRRRRDDRRLHSEERRERGDHQYRVRIRDPRSPREFVEHPRHVEIRDGHSSGSEHRRRQQRNLRSGSESDSDVDSRRYPRSYRSEYRSLSPRSPYNHERDLGHSPYENERGPYPDRPYHPEDRFTPPPSEPYYRDEYRGYRSPRADPPPPPLPERSRDLAYGPAGPRPGYPEHYRSADNHTYEYISPVRYPDDRRSWYDVPDRSPRQQVYDLSERSPLRGPQYMDRRPDHSPLRGSPYLERPTASPVRGHERSDSSPMRGPRYDQPVQVPAYLEPYRERAPAYRPADYHDPRYAQVQRSRPAYPRQDGVVFIPPEAQLSDTEVRYGRGSPDFIIQAMQYGYRPYQDHPGTRRSYPSYNPDPYYHPRTEPIHPDFASRVPYHAFPDQLNPPADYRKPPDYNSPTHRFSYPYQREINDRPMQLGTVPEGLDLNRHDQGHVSAFRQVESDHNGPAAAPVNDFYSDFSLGKPGHAVEAPGRWNYGDPRNSTARPSRLTTSTANVKQPDPNIGQDTSQTFIAPVKPIKLVPDRSNEVTKPPISGFRDAFQYQPYHIQTPLVKQAEKGVEIQRTTEEALDNSRKELDQALEDLGLVASIEIPKESKPITPVNKLQVKEHVTYDRVSSTVIRCSRTPSTDQERERENILAEKGVIFHNVPAKVTVKTAVPQPARYARSSSDTKVEGKVKAKRPTHLPVKSEYKPITNLSSSVPNLKNIGDQTTALDAVLSDLKMASLKRRTESETSSPRRRTRRSTASESDSSVISDSRSVPEMGDRRRLREVMNSPTQAGDYLVDRPPDPRRAGLTPERRPCAFHDDLAYRQLRRRNSEDKSASLLATVNVGKTRPVAKGIDQLISKLASVEAREQNHKSRSLPDLSSVAAFSVQYNERGDIVTEDPKFSQHAVSPRKTPRTVKVRSKMRQRMAEFIISTESNDSSDERNQPFPDLLPYDESASEDASHEFEPASRGSGSDEKKSSRYRREPLDIEVFNPRLQTVEKVRDHYASHEQIFNNVVSYFEHEINQNGSLRKYASHDDIARGESKTARRLKTSPEASSLKERCGSDPCLSEGRTLERKKDGVYRSVLHFTVGSEEDLRTSSRPPKSQHRIDM